MKVLNTYICKDGRVRASIIDDDMNKRRTISYPRVLMGQRLGRKLLPNEDVHHIDGNPLNNDISNLQILMHGDHQYLHNLPKYFDKIMTCPICQQSFIWTSKQQSEFYRNCHRRIPKNKSKSSTPFCSKRCSGIYSKQIQKTYEKNKNLLEVLIFNR